MVLYTTVDSFGFYATGGWDEWGGFLLTSSTIEDDETDLFEPSGADCDILALFSVWTERPDRAFVFAKTVCWILASRL